MRLLIVIMLYFIIFLQLCCKLISLVKYQDFAIKILPFFYLEISI